jgi:hypothetical protein
MRIAKGTHKQRANNLFASPIRINGESTEAEFGDELRTFSTDPALFESI